MTYSDADAGTAFAKLQSLHPSMEGLGDSIRHPTTGVEVGVRQKDAEFIAPESGGHIDLATGVSQHVANRLEDLVPLLMAQ